MTSLFDAIKSGDAGRVRQLVAADPGLAAGRDETGLSAVLVAIYHRQAEARDALLAADPELDVLEAAALGRIDLLREAGPDALAARGVDGFTPLHLAAFFGGADAVRVLLAAGAPADADDANAARVRPLHSATAAGDHGAVAALLAAGADPNARQNGGYTPLLQAAHADDPELARMLLDAGADPAAAADDGRDVAAMAGPRVRELLGAAR
jgi:ankyrin repeat protein